MNDQYLYLFITLLTHIQHINCLFYIFILYLDSMYCLEPCFSLLQDDDSFYYILLFIVL